MSLPPDYALNPMPTDVKARILSTNINLDEGTCSIALVERAAEYFGLTLTAARNVIREVAAQRSRIGEMSPSPSARGRLRSAGWRAPSSMMTWLALGPYDGMAGKGAGA